MKCCYVFPSPQACVLQIEWQCFTFEGMIPILLQDSPWNICLTIEIKLESQMILCLSKYCFSVPDAASHQPR